jgi:very-short-patch-repair endonuclease
MPNKKTTSVHPDILARARKLRRPLTPQENKLWQRLRKKQLHSLKFRRQHPIHRFILDFFCYEHQIAIEIDGHHHYTLEQQTYDKERTQWLEQRGIKVIRFTNHEVVHVGCAEERSAL